ncbi:hypothetical protein [Escherichia coli]|uniref:hypothetical protein n=1 Tax=Escherichia coli TaxID=562 RepID=UPI00112507AC|nr:hypothetical protein [Escherichia coli]
MKKLLLLTLLFPLSGWCDELPDCSSKEVTDGILSNMNSQVGKIEGKTVFESITDSRPQQIDRDVNKVVCASVLNAWIYPYPGTTMLPFTLVTLPFRFTVQGANGKLYYETFPKEFTADTRAAQEQARYQYKLKYDQEQAQKKSQGQQKTTIQQPTTTQSISTKSLKVPSCSDDNAISSLRETFVEDFQDSQLKDAFYEMNLFSITDSVLVKAHPDANECKGEVEWIVNPDKKPAYVPIYYSFYADGRITYDRDAFWSEIKKAETAGKSKNPTVFPKNAPPSTYTYSVNQNRSTTQKSVEMTKYKNLTDNKKYGSSVISLNSKDNTLQINGTTNPDNPMSTTCDITGNIANEFKQNGNQYDLTKGSCNVTVVIGNTEGTVKIKGNCQDYCGVNGDPNVLNGQYK